VKLDGLRAGGPYEMTVSGKNSLTVRNVAVGEVWVCGGESNMEYKVLAARNGPAEAADGDLPMVRVFKVKHNAAETPREDCEGAWEVCDPDTAKDFPAIRIFLCPGTEPDDPGADRGDRERMGGQSPAEAWTAEGGTRERPGAAWGAGSLREKRGRLPRRSGRLSARLAEWQAARDATSAATAPPP